MTKHLMKFQIGDIVYDRYGSSICEVTQVKKGSCDLRVHVDLEGTWNEGFEYNAIFFRLTRYNSIEEAKGNLL